MQLVIYIVLVSLCLDNRSTLAFTAGDQTIELDMAMNSAAYIFTQTPAADEAAIGYIRKEWAERKHLLDVWNNASKSFGPNYEIPRGLKREHLMAIHAYTQQSPLYSEFNTAVRECGVSDAIYKRSFHFKSFHYLLSVALDKLKSNKRKTYRGTSIPFNAKTGGNVRLGQFASSSLELEVAKQFMSHSTAENTLFEIETKLGVPISAFSSFPKQEEVLIPPIEVFKVKSTLLWVKGNKWSWRKITLATNGCKGIAVTVKKGRNGKLEVKRGNGWCPKFCKCFKSWEFLQLNNTDISSLTRNGSL